MSDPLTAAVLHEIADIHDFFARWFGGRIEHTEANFARFRDALDPAFAQVNPAGLLRPHGTILRDVWAHWRQFGDDPGFRIWVDAARVHHVLPGDHAVAVYQEWHEYRGKQVGRTCTGVLCRRSGTPTGIAWMQMHESLMAVGATHASP
jgi:hypothetical protein